MTSFSSYLNSVPLASAFFAVSMASRISWFTRPESLFYMQKYMLTMLHFQDYSYNTECFVQWKYGREGSYLARPTFILHVCEDALQALLRVFWVIRSSILKVNDLRPVLGNIFRGQFLVNWKSVATGSLPSCSSNPTTANLIETASWGVRYLIAAQ